MIATLKNLPHTFVSSLRAHNYTLFRKIVDNPIVYGVLSRISASYLIPVKLHQDTVLYVNPLYHSQFLSVDNVVGYEPEFREALMQLIEPGMCVYDVGANIGVFSLLMAELVSARGRLYAFEPEEVNLNCLEKSCTGNAWSHVTIVPKCVSSESCEITFDRRGGAFSGRGIMKDCGILTSNTTKKQAVSLDDFVFKDNHQVPDMIKIDVEGNEIGVLLGMTRILEEHSPTIICEMHHHLIEDFTCFYETLRSRGYRCMDLQDWLRGEIREIQPLSQASRVIAVKESVSTKL